MWCYNGQVMADPEELPSLIKQLVEVKKSKKQPSEVRHVMINRLRYFGLDIIQVLHTLGYIESDTSTDKMPSHSYTYLIGDNLCFYNIKIKYSKRYIVTIIDLDNLLSISNPQDIVDTWGDGDLTVKSLADSYKKAISDLLLMTGIHRKIPITIAGAARRVYFRDTQKHYDCKDCTKFFDGAENYFRGAYHGGLNLYKDNGHIRVYNNVTCYDVNSLYPYVMAYRPYPVGRPWAVAPEDLIKIDRRAKKGQVYYYIHIKTSFKLKPGHPPCVCMSRNDPNRWLYDRMWMTDSRVTKPDGTKNKDYKIIDLYLTQTDFKLFLKCYDVMSLDIIDIWCFQAKMGLFKEYVDRWYNLKKTSTGGRKRVAKIMLNSLSGSMARRTDYINGRVIFDSRDIAEIKYDKIKSKHPSCFVHIGAAITSYAREIIVNKIIDNYDNWLYTDTDSLHLAGDQTVNVPISDNIGDFKVEHKYQEICYYQLKEYIYKEENIYHLTMAGVERRDTEDISNYLSHRNPTNDYWVTGKKEYVDGWKSLFTSDNKMIDMYKIHIPVSYTSRKDWFDTDISYTWITYYNDNVQIDKVPVVVKVKPTSVKDLRDRDKKKSEYWDKTHKDDKTLSIREWLTEIAIREKQMIESKKDDFKTQQAKTRYKTGQALTYDDKVRLGLVWVHVDDKDVPFYNS